MMWKPSSKQKKIIKHLTCKQSSNEDHNKQPESPIKKQVRRRKHTTKPYQQRLLNMAEARKEIVTALKFHRASMKQQQTATTTTVTALPPPLPPFNHQNLDFTLPKQTLGLNLNFQDFQILEEKSNLYHNPLSNFPISSSSSSSAVISLTTEEVDVGTSDEVVTVSSDAATISSSTSSSSSCGGALMNRGLHHVMDDEELEEIRSLGEQHQMEWNDTVNLLTSARWFNFLKTIESEEFQEDGRFDEDVEFPHWLDIDEIEGMDGEWLA